jgi:hypothetical protein
VRERERRRERKRVRKDGDGVRAEGLIQNFANTFPS